MKVLTFILDNLLIILKTGFQLTMTLYAIVTEWMLLGDMKQPET